MKKYSNLKMLLSKPIAFHASLAIIGGSVASGLMLSQAFYWSTRTKKGDGWFYKSREEWFEETTLTRREQETARKMLKERGFMEESLRGVPATMHFRINEENIEKALIIYSKSLEVNSWAESAQLDGRNPPNLYGGNVPTSWAESAQHLILTETTTETTSEITQEEIVPIPLWLAFVEMRKKKRAPLTAHAGELIRKQLAKFKDQGHDPVEVLEQSIRNSWSDVYPPKESKPNGTIESFSERQRRKSQEAISGVRSRAESVVSEVGRRLPDSRSH